MAAAQYEIVRLQAGGRPRHQPRLLAVGHAHGERARDVAHDVVAHDDQLVGVGVVLVGPHQGARLRIGEPHGQPELAAALPHAALGEIADLEIAGDLLATGRAALVGGDGARCEHRQVGKAGERADDVLGEPVGEVVVAGIERGQRQNGDREPAGGRHGLGSPSAPHHHTPPRPASTRTTRPASSSERAGRRPALPQQADRPPRPASLPSRSRALPRAHRTCSRGAPPSSGWTAPPRPGTPGCR